MFGTWIGQIVKTYDCINRVVIMLPLSVYEGTWTHSPLSLLCITMILRVHRKFLKLLPVTTTPISEEANDDDHVTSDQVTTKSRR